MVDVSTFEDPIAVKLAMLLHLPGRCVGQRSRIWSMWILLFKYAAIQLYANYAEVLHFHIYLILNDEVMCDPLRVNQP